jgi:transcriptional regulator with XRE-family HTH domain
MDVLDGLCDYRLLQPNRTFVCDNDKLPRLEPTLAGGFFGASGRAQVAASPNPEPSGASVGQGKSRTSVDDHVAAQVRGLRVTHGLTQAQVAEMIGISRKQFYKCEKGIDRFSVGRLWDIAQALNTPISYFYKGIDDDTARQPLPQQSRLRELARSLSEISDERHLEVISHITRLLADH